MPICQTQVSFFAFASSASSATATQSPVSPARTQSKTGSAFQSFQQPSLALRVADGSAVCTPSVIAVHPAAPVVAHGVDGGECTYIDRRRVHVERPSLLSIREEFWLDHMHPGWAGVGLDAPTFLPSGSSVVLGLECGCPFVDGTVSRPWGYV